ncbi:hypothetical protein AB0M46_05645 [Dactylosporangium sp. NPDC051485]|uniref:hypothetical protein n=1 Tax=Dactylosporangium sp. NPDC051485 TaxID=3154846 RepID=UPI003415707F
MAMTTVSPNPAQTVPASPNTDANEMLHVVQFSGGIGSWATAMRVAAEHGTDRLVLLAADTKVEDPDLWRFVREAAAHLGVTPVVVADGRNPWQVFADQRFIGNSRIAPCSRVLKQKPCRDWLTANADPATTVLYVGIDWSEQRRTPAIERGWQPWTVRFPMCEPPYLTKAQMLEWARAEGIEPPRAYAEGFSHNNCFGACVRAGQGQWRHLLAVAPERFAAAEAEEERLRDELGDVAILRERRKGVSRPLPLRELRRRATAIAPPERGPDAAATNRSA